MRQKNYGNLYIIFLCEKNFKNFANIIKKSFIPVNKENIILYHCVANDTAVLRIKFISIL